MVEHQHLFYIAHLVAHIFPFDLSVKVVNSDLILLLFKLCNLVVFMVAQTRDAKIYLIIAI